jgi:hypothetical protein
MLWIAVGACGCTGESGSGSGADASLTEDSGATSDGPKPDTGATCDIPECLRPYNCRLSCSGPILSSSCCPCAPPAFDDICCSRDACPL